jgi:transposase-like protein
MPPKLDNRPDAAELLEEVRQPGANLCAIARRLGVHRNTVRAFRDKHLPKSVRDADARLSRLPRVDLQVSQLERLDAVAAKLDMMTEAIDRALRDPDDPTRYNLDPRAREVTVVFEETVGERRVQKVRKLDDLLERVERGLGVSVVRWEVKSADLRVLLKDLAVAIKPIAELLGKTRGEIRPDPAATLNVFLGSAEWTQLETVLLESLRPYPPALEAAGRALATIGGPADAR